MSAGWYGADMGYTLHVTRAEDWTESEARPLTAAEWRAYVAREPSLEPGPDGDVTWTPAPAMPPLLLRWHASPTSLARRATTRGCAPGRACASSAAHVARWYAWTPGRCTAAASSPCATRTGAS